jgi:hypothetical protein
MNFRLVLMMSMFGLAMALGTVFVIPSNIEPIFWLIIFGVVAFMIAKRAPGRYFLHGFCTSLLNCVWITTAHVLFYDTYVAGHAEEVARSASLPVQGRLAMILVGPVIGVVSGLVLGLLSFIASKLVKPDAPPAAKA